MASLSHAQIIEAFHLGLLEVLRKGLGETRFVLKGGANLRYFFDSPRYSEDMDLDAAGIEGWSLKEKVDEALRSRPLAYLLSSTGSEVLVDEVTEPKQTDTTRRWKVPIKASGHRDPIRTKIEFSDRNGDTRHALDTVPGKVVERYGLRPPLVQHYLAEPATEQKVLALAGRPETQARDVFDLDLLLRKHPLTPGNVPAATRKSAADRGLELPYEAFADQVLPFLDPDVAVLYDEASWRHMQLFVTDKLLEEDG